MYFFCTPRKRAYCVLSTLIDFFLVAGAFQIHRVKGLSSYLYTLFVIFLVARWKHRGNHKIFLANSNKYAKLNP